MYTQKERLLEDIPVPDWLADPSHRTKVVAKPIYLLASLSKNVSLCTKVDAIRFKKYFGYMIKTNRNKGISQIMTASKVVVDHFFDNNEFCDKKWYKPLKQKQEGKEKELSQSYYCSKINDAKLYA